eukprot:g3341.t1
MLLTPVGTNSAQGRSQQDIAQEADSDVIHHLLAQLKTVKMDLSKHRASARALAAHRKHDQEALRDAQKDASKFKALHEASLAQLKEARSDAVVAAGGGATATTCSAELAALQKAHRTLKQKCAVQHQGRPHSGLVVKTEYKPPGACALPAKKGDKIYVHYTGFIDESSATGEKGKQFGTSRGGGTTFGFPLGKGMVIKGWDQGLVGMCIGEKRTLVVPPSLGYGKEGSGSNIPGDATLRFAVERFGDKEATGGGGGSASNSTITSGCSQRRGWQ